jgi:transaldolase
MTTTYHVTGIAPDLFVVNDMGAKMGGPYKNDESAKRRIRDLKRKEAEAIASVPTATSEVATLVEAAKVITEAVDTIVAEVAAMPIAPALPDAAKLAASSAYGKTAMPAGVYPAINKSERRKRWNYA